MASKSLFMESTRVPAQKTASEITMALVAGGARQIAVDYDAHQRPIGMNFGMVVNQVPVAFRMPVRIDPIYKILIGRRKGYLNDKVKDEIRAQAERVAWRQLLRWCQAQLAMIETGMVQTHEVFLPYMQNEDGRTVFEMLTESRFKALPAPEVQRG